MDNPKDSLMLQLQVGLSRFAAEGVPPARAGNASAGRPTRIIIRAAKGESWQRERWERESWQRERWETAASKLR